ncbi:hypothetical protein BKA70DRAFT_1228081 [Coprinopsis sp. MPI-PUGE-AT-0042]|nr:hypothetical protein BKA70DRAFT_1228081 [Coprinopsis sp. MPI-PUGE-AT-0042]
MNPKGPHTSAQEQAPMTVLVPTMALRLLELPLAPQVHPDCRFCSKVELALSSPDGPQPCAMEILHQIQRDYKNHIPEQLLTAPSTAIENAIGCAIRAVHNERIESYRLQGIIQAYEARVRLLENAIANLLYIVRLRFVHHFRINTAFVEACQLSIPPFVSVSLVSLAIAVFLNCVGHHFAAFSNDHHRHCCDAPFCQYSAPLTTFALMQTTPYAHSTLRMIGVVLVASPTTTSMFLLVHHRLPEPVIHAMLEDGGTCTFQEEYVAWKLSKCFQWSLKASEDWYHRRQFDDLLGFCGAIENQLEALTEFNNSESMLDAFARFGIAGSKFLEVAGEFDSADPFAMEARLRPPTPHDTCRVEGKWEASELGYLRSVARVCFEEDYQTRGLYSSDGEEQGTLYWQIIWPYVALAGSEDGLVAWLLSQFPTTASGTSLVDGSVLRCGGRVGGEKVRPIGTGNLGTWFARERCLTFPTLDGELWGITGYRVEYALLTRRWLRVADLVETADLLDRDSFKWRLLDRPSYPSDTALSDGPQPASALHFKACLSGGPAIQIVSSFGSKDHKRIEPIPGLKYSGFGSNSADIAIPPVIPDDSGTRRLVNLR